MNEEIQLREKVLKDVKEYHDRELVSQTCIEGR